MKVFNKKLFIDLLNKAGITWETGRRMGQGDYHLVQKGDVKIHYFQYDNFTGDLHRDELVTFAKRIMGFFMDDIYAGLFKEK